MNANNRKTFQFSYTSEDDGHKYEGQFTTKRLSIKDRGMIGVRKSQLMGGMYCVRDDKGNPTGQGVDEDTDFLNAMIAHLEVSLMQKPQWWNLDEIADMGLVRAVYQEVADFEMSFFRGSDGSNSQGESGQVGSGNSGEKRPGPGSGNAPTPVVDQKVQAALDA
jgi:hypothetical protein